MKKRYMIVVILSLIMAIALFVGQGCNNYVYGKSINNAEEEKVYCTATLDDEFAEDKILVVLNTKTSRQFKDYSPNNFSEIDCIEVNDLTSHTVDYVEENYDKQKGEFKSVLNKKMLVDFESFNRILCLRIENGTKEKVLQSIKILEKRKDIYSAEPDYLLKGSSEPTAEYYEDGEQWGLNGVHGINAPKAWDITTGSSTVLVGVLDTGIDSTHPDLANRIHRSTPHNDTTTLHRDFIYGTIDGINVTHPDDQHGHGTHVAGIIGAGGNSINQKVSGVCQNVKLVSLRVSNEENEMWGSHVVNAISYATSKNIPILNASFENDWTGNTLASMKTAINTYAGLVVCAAGNKSRNNDDIPTYPANLSTGYSFSDRVISVGATTKNGLMATENDWKNVRLDGSNYGATTVSLFAPGTLIFSADSTIIADTTNYALMSGTSQAAPFVTGVAALMLSVDPSLTAAELKAGIMNNVDKTSALQGLCVSGGKLNAFKAVSSVAYNLTDIDDYEIQIDGFINNTVKNSITGELTIPDTINGKTVTRIGDNAFSGSVFTSITIPSSVYYVGVSAFSGLGTTQSIIIEGNALERSGWNLDWANGCNAVVDYTAGDSGELSPSDYLSFINVSGGLKAQLSGNICPAEVLIPATYNGMPIVDIDGFSDCFTLQRITIEGENIDYIWSYAFANCVNLQEITLPDSIFSAGSYAFYECYSLERVNCSGVNLEYIEDYAFAYCHNLQEINLSRGVIYIGYRAFFECMDLPYVNFSNGVLVSEDAFFACGSITSITIAGDEGYLTEGMLTDHMMITIYTDQTEWGENWLFVEDRIFYLTVVYGCTLAEDEVYVISIVVDASAINEEHIMMPPDRDGYTFAGWSTTEGGEVEYTMDDLIILDGMTLYAVWTPAG